MSLRGLTMITPMNPCTMSWRVLIRAFMEMSTLDLSHPRMRSLNDQILIELEEAY